MKLVLIGCGNMGSAIGQAVLRAGTSVGTSTEVQVFDVSADKCQPLVDLGATALSRMDDAQIDADTLVLIAVKPQYIDPVLNDLASRMDEAAVLVSIAAGVTMQRLQKGAGHERVVRVMPNTPAMIGEGASAWMASPQVTDEQKRNVTALLETFGVAIEVSDEDQIDAVTALSGSGPAYMFAILEAMIEGGTRLGLSQEDSLKLAIQTMIGGGKLAERHAQALEQIQTLRANVTSKGGTTERALATFTEKGLHDTLIAGMQAAYDRAKEL